MNKKLAGTGLAIGLVAGAGAGLVLELAGNAGAAPANFAAVTADTSATTDTTGTTAPSGTTDTSGSTGSTTTPDANRPDPSTKLQDILKPLVDNGTITQAQADAVVAAIVAARPADGHDGGPFGGHRGPGGFGDVIGAGLDTVATTLGITRDDVLTALKNGQSLADLAVAHGKTAQDVIDAIVAEAKTKLDAAVTAGNLTQAQADKILTEVTTHATDLVNNSLPAGLPGLGGPGGFPGFGRGFGPHGDDGDSDDSGSGSGSGSTTATTAPAGN